MDFVSNLMNKDVFFSSKLVLMFCFGVFNVHPLLNARLLAKRVKCNIDRWKIVHIRVGCVVGAYSVVKCAKWFVCKGTFIWPYILTLMCTHVLMLSRFLNQSSKSMWVIFILMLMAKAIVSAVCVCIQ